MEKLPGQSRVLQLLEMVQIFLKVSMVGNDSSLDTGIGTCGKDGQSVPVGVGQPTLKIDEILVGGSDTQD